MSNSAIMCQLLKVQRPDVEALPVPENEKVVLKSALDEAGIVASSANLDCFYTLRFSEKASRPLIVNKSFAMENYLVPLITNSITKVKDLLGDNVEQGLESAKTAEKNAGKLLEDAKKVVGEQRRSLDESNNECLKTLKELQGECEKNTNKAIELAEEGKEKAKECMEIVGEIQQNNKKCVALVKEVDEQRIECLESQGDMGWVDKRTAFILGALALSVVQSAVSAISKYASKSIALTIPACPEGGLACYLSPELKPIDESGSTVY